MTNLDAISIIEDGAEDETRYIAAFQHLIDNGLVWRLQGFYGREARRLMDAGLVT